MADFTYIWTAEGWLYVAAVIDLFSRRVVGWSMSDTMTAQLVTDALVMATWRRGKPDAWRDRATPGHRSAERTKSLLARTSSDGRYWSGARDVRSRADG